jgi:hypothetical protein
MVAISDEHTYYEWNEANGKIVSKNYSDADAEKWHKLVQARLDSVLEEYAVILEGKIRMAHIQPLKGKIY